MILIHVDDNPADRLFVNDILSKISLDYELIQFGDLNSALNHLENHNEAESLLLLDLVLPPYRNLEALEVVLKDYPLIPIVVITGEGNIEKGKKAISLGAIDFLEKEELSPRYLERSLNYVKERMHLMNDLRESNSVKTKLLSLIAHDLKSPIASIASIAELMESDIENLNKAELQMELDLLLNTTEKASTLLNNLLDWSRMQLGTKIFKTEVLNLKAILDEALNFQIDLAAKKGIKMITRGNLHEEFLGDYSSIQSIFRNILNNALKFSPKGAEILIDVKKDKDILKVEFQDFGIGIPTKILAKLFKLNESTGRSGTEGEPSSGLGLILVQEYAKMNKARIEVESQENIGSTFRLILNQTKT